MLFYSGNNDYNNGIMVNLRIQSEMVMDIVNIRILINKIIIKVVLLFILFKY